LRGFLFADLVASNANNKSNNNAAEWGLVTCRLNRLRVYYRNSNNYVPYIYIYK
jgi:hypothetical protein